MLRGNINKQEIEVNNEQLKQALPTSRNSYAHHNPKRKKIAVEEQTVLGEAEFMIYSCL